MHQWQEKFRDVKILEAATMFPMPHKFVMLVLRNCNVRGLHYEGVE